MPMLGGFFTYMVINRSMYSLFSFDSLQYSNGVFSPMACLTSWDIFCLLNCCSKILPPLFVIWKSIPRVPFCIDFMPSADKRFGTFSCGNYGKKTLLFGFLCRAFEICDFLISAEIHLRGCDIFHAIIGASKQEGADRDFPAAW